MSGHLTMAPAQPRGCGHTRHVGTCGACQRAQLARWHAQLVHASNARVYQDRTIASLSWSESTPNGPRRS